MTAAPLSPAPAKASPHLTLTVTWVKRWTDQLFSFACERPEDFRILDDIEKYFSPSKPMLTDWDPADIEGLSDTIRSRPEGGEIGPAAKDGNATGNVSISVFK